MKGLLKVFLFPLLAITILASSAIIDKNSALALDNAPPTKAISKNAVGSGEAKILGYVLNYKNPFNPGIGESTNITYTLNQDAAVTIYIYNMIGQYVKRISCFPGSEGGKAGYNRVAWDGYSDFKELMGNDVYLAKIVAFGKVIGKCKIAILK